MTKAEAKNKILVILGPTASGKSDLAVILAKKFNGEIISADSRQVYRGLNIGTGKITKKEMEGVPHHLLDVASPKKQFSVAEYQKLGRRAILKIRAKNKLPIICGGTGHYIDALINGTLLPDVPPDPKLRAKLGKLSPAQLFEKLKILDPARARNIDPQNPRRLIRALEIVLKTGRPVPPPHSSTMQDAGISAEDILKIGIKVSSAKLREQINTRLIKRMRQGMAREAKKLHTLGLSWKRMEELGLEYRYLARYLQGLVSRQEMLRKLETEIWRYAKRQETWLKRDKDIIWLENRPALAVAAVRKWVK